MSELFSNFLKNPTPLIALNAASVVILTLTLVHVLAQLALFWSHRFIYRRDEKRFIKKYKALTPEDLKKIEDAGLLPPWVQFPHYYSKEDFVDKDDAV